MFVSPTTGQAERAVAAFLLDCANDAVDGMWPVEDLDRRRFLMSGRVPDNEPNRAVVQSVAVALAARQLSDGQVAAIARRAYRTWARRATIA